jgi:hypothetical protein
VYLYIKRERESVCVCEGVTKLHKITLDANRWLFQRRAVDHGWGTQRFVLVVFFRKHLSRVGVAPRAGAGDGVEGGDSRVCGGRR